ICADWHTARHAVECAECGRAGSDGVTSRGADGPARRSCSMSRASGTGPPPIHSPRTAAGHDRVARPSRRSPYSELLAGPGPEPGADASPRLKEPAAWTDSPAGSPGWLKGGLDIPATDADGRSLRGEHPLRTWTRRTDSRAGRVGIFVFHPIA